MVNICDWYMRKALIITYYWPPSGGGGVQRWLKFAKYLPQFGWQPVIFTPENPDFNIKDESLTKDVSADTEVLKLPIWEPYQLFEKVTGKKTPAQGLTNLKQSKSLLTKAAMWIRGNVFIPDPKRYWVKPAVKFLKEIIETNNIDVVVTTGPPHSMHLIGLQLQKQLGVCWVADFRDPWSKWDMLDNFNLSRLARWQHKRLEHNVLRQADEVITVSTTWAEEFAGIYERNYHVITNGFDEEDFDHYKRQSNSDKFIISHFGLLNAFRNPEVLWQVLEELLNENLEIELHLYGMIEPQIIALLQTYTTLWRNTVVKPPVSHDEVLRAYQEADVLLLLLNHSENAKGHLPGKLFEYLATDRPILALGPPASDASAIIQKTQTGATINWADYSGMKEYLMALIDRPGAFNSHADEVAKFSRARLTDQLVNEVLNPLVKS